ncbi:hypothetical protein [Caballeronia sp. Lep1P3]|uniref:hypothetical protein n=1 Tax=Caballeronia sp. Lep1P3 TaxID=2878150 RepID=UPI0002ED9E75|nr:hypothetical protein [Caballeronia sp. Lep1P3]
MVVSRVEMLICVGMGVSVRTTATVGMVVAVLMVGLVVVLPLRVRTLLLQVKRQLSGRAAASGVAASSGFFSPYLLF